MTELNPEARPAGAGYRLLDFTSLGKLQRDDPAGRHHRIAGIEVSGKQSETRDGPGGCGDSGDGRPS